MIGDTIVYCLYIDKENIKIYTLDIRYKQLSSQIKTFRKILTDYESIKANKEEDYDNYVTIAYWFYEQLINPILVDKHNINGLIIIPDRELGHIPFEAFLTQPANGEDYHELPYLVHQYQVSYNYSTHLWKDNHSRNIRQNNGQMLAMAADYSTSLDSSAFEQRSPIDIKFRRYLSPLPAARKEVTFLENNFNGFFGFDSMATEAIFKEKATNYAIIHLAMHGLLNRHIPNLSSLAFTEDGNISENNFLHAYEISRLELNAELIVLSACETGYGKFETGNGVASLARSFMYAGVPAMVVSLWEVNDVSTAKIMELMYLSLAEGLSKT